MLAGFDSVRLACLSLDDAPGSLSVFALVVDEALRVLVVVRLLAVFLDVLAAVLPLRRLVLRGADLALLLLAGTGSIISWLSKCW